MTGKRGDKSGRVRVPPSGDRLLAPDVRASFESEAHLQSLAVAGSASARGDQAFIDATSDWQAE
jgi:hypothetical protein